MGKQQKFEALLRPVLGDLYRFAVRLTRDPVAAEDLLQRALERGYSRIDTLTDPGAYRVWQCRVLHTTWLNTLRKRTPNMVETKELDRTVIPFERPDPERQLERRQLSEQISDALDGLPVDQRDAVWLVDGMGMKFAEAADVLQLPPGTVASRVARGRIALRVSLKGVAAEEGVGR